MNDRRLSGLSIDSRRALARLANDERECFLLVRVEGYTQEEAASKLGLSRLAVHRRINKAEDNLRKLLFNRRTISASHVPYASEG